MSSRTLPTGFLVALLLLSAALTTEAALEVPDSDCVALGTVESAQSVSLEERRRTVGEIGLKGVFDRHFEALHDMHHADELIVRLDDGRELSITYYGMARFRPGQRVRVIASPAGPRVELA